MLVVDPRRPPEAEVTGSNPVGRTEEELRQRRQLKAQIPWLRVFVEGVVIVGSRPRISPIQPSPRTERLPSL